MAKEGKELSMWIRPRIDCVVRDTPPVWVAYCEALKLEAVGNTQVRALDNLTNLVEERIMGIDAIRLRRRDVWK